MARPGAVIKPSPVEFTAHGQLGPVSGWNSLDDAIRAVASLTSGDEHGAGAIVRTGDRFVAHALTEGAFGPDVPVTLTGTIRNFGGAPWVHRDVAAFVDGAWVERIRA